MSLKVLPKPEELLKKEIFAVWKPRGWRSFEVVEVLRRYTGVKKIGFSGTLDPYAEGVLVIGIGKGTKKLASLSERKVYYAEIALGLETETWDLEAKHFTLHHCSEVSGKEI